MGKGEEEGGGGKGKGCQLLSSSSTDGQISFLHFLPLCAVCLFDRPPPNHHHHHHHPFLLFLLPSSLPPPCAAHVQQVNLCRNHANTAAGTDHGRGPFSFSPLSLGSVHTFVGGVDNRPDNRVGCGRVF